jgi:hypothetical protein
MEGYGWGDIQQNKKTKAENGTALVSYFSITSISEYCISIFLGIFTSKISSL